MLCMHGWALIDFNTRAHAPIQDMKKLLYALHPAQYLNDLYRDLRLQRNVSFSLPLTLLSLLIVRTTRQFSCYSEIIISRFNIVIILG